ncbi:MAG TPA: 16S rRNA processing protein RimM [Firmicutes bacterium]|nr:16S rRNA processing protein RimM [Bacillota bacterium]
MADRRVPDIAIGKIVSPHGVTGSVKVLPYTDFRERCFQLRDVDVYVGNPGLPPSKKMTVTRASVYGGFWLIKFTQVKTREEAAGLKGCLIYIFAEDRFPLPNGSYYYDQIIGLEVHDVSGKYLGKVVEIRSTGAHDLYLIDRASGKGREILLPAVKEFVKEINLEQGTIMVQIPEGLDEL